MTADQLAQAFTDAGIDTPDKLVPLLAKAAALVDRQDKAYALTAALQARFLAIAAEDTKVAQAQAALDAADAALTK